MAADMNKTPSGDRIHIGFFGRRNAGKSSVVNAVTAQNISIVSDVKGTTTDPVTKAMEILPLGPVLIIDTPGIDDEGTVGEMRVQSARRMLNKTDVAVLVVDSATGKCEYDIELEKLFLKKSIPYITVYNKSDVKSVDNLKENEIAVSALSGENIDKLKEMIASLAEPALKSRRIIGDKLNREDIVLLVTPIDSSAPKGRMILPQVQAIRDILDSNAICMVAQTEQLESALSSLKAPPKLVITDSQAFGRVKDIVPDDIKLTSFSILLASYKGFLEDAVNGVIALKDLKDGDRVIISEGCTHHRQCEDIGTVKLPEWIRKYTGCNPQFEFTSGGKFPEKLDGCSLVIHCGACMLNDREILYRAECAADMGVPFTNYGTAIAYMNGILKRSLSPFPELQAKIQT